jgi:putative phage-type endonuclease
MKTHDDLIQGSAEWHAHRATHLNASDAPAMMGCSAYTTRTQLLQKLHSGIAPLVDAATQRRFDEGHRIEALARPLAAKIIGEDLYPMVGTSGELSASFDGLTMDESTVFEHKTLNDELRACMRDQGNGFDLPMQYQVQMEQQLMVSGAERALFMATKWDGDNLVEELHCWYASDPKLRAQIVAGWKQFAIDLAAYVPTAPTIAAVAAPVESLPAVSVRLDGQLVVASNLPEFGVALRAFIERIPTRPSTDQQFADCESACKALKKAEDALESSETHALAQMLDVNDLRRTIADLRNLARQTRLASEKAVTARKEQVRLEIVQDGNAALREHIIALNKRLGFHYMPTIVADFAGAVKGKRTVDSLRDAVNTTLANAKIQASAIADKIQHNLALLNDELEYSFLFADAAHIVQKDADDFTALVKNRITAHKAAEAAKEAALVARIEAEAKEKAEREARAKMEAEQVEAKATADRLAADAASTAAAAEQLIKDRAAEAARVATESARVERIVTAPDIAPALTHTQVVQQMPATVRQAMAPKPATAPTLTLGTLSERLGVNVTSTFLATLGFEATVVKAARLFHEEDFSEICEALKTHISEVQEQFESATA